MGRWVILLLSLALLTSACSAPAPQEPRPGLILDVPDPKATAASLEETIRERDSQRQFADEPISQEVLARILWAAAGPELDGITAATRTFPSAGATYATTIYVVAGNVEDLAQGVYRYVREDHQLRQIRTIDLRQDLARASLNQIMIAQAPVSIVVAADFVKTTSRYGDRGRRYVHMEAGAVMQNVSLQAQALGLASVIVGSFDDDRVRRVLEVEHPVLLVIPVGYRP